MTILDHVVAVVAGLVLPLLGAQQHRGVRSAAADPDTFDTRLKIALYWSNSLFLWILTGAALFAWLYAGRTLHDLGVSAPPRRLGAGLLLALVFILVYSIDTWRQLATPERLAKTRARWRRDTPFMPATPREVRHSLVLVATAAVGEEIVYRGFLIAYFSHFTGASAAGVAMAVVLPAAIFAVCHFYQGARAVAKIATLACLFGAILVVTGSLWIPMVLHFLVDLVGTILGPKLLAPDGTSPDADVRPRES